MGARWMLILLVAASLGLVSGCGSVKAGSSQATATAQSTSRTSLASASSKDTPNASPAVEEMSVFLRPRLQADRLPEELSYRVHREPCPQEIAPARCPGDAIPDDSRLLLSGLGVRKTSLYAWPTTKGWVCWAWDEGAGGCIRDFAQAEIRVAFMGIDPDDEGTGDPGTLVGVVPDDVAATQVQVRGIAHAAIMESNGIFYELPNGSCTNWAFEWLTAFYRDGTSKTTPINWHHGSSELPETCQASPSS
jgi:hypothetical protein